MDRRDKLDVAASVGAAAFGKRHVPLQSIGRASRAGTSVIIWYLCILCCICVFVYICVLWYLCIFAV